MMDDLLTARAELLFNDQDWPSPSEESWRRTPLKRLLPEGFLDEAVKAGPVAASLKVSGQSGGQPSLPEGVDALILIEDGMLRKIDVSSQAASRGLSIRWLAREDWPSDMVYCGMGELENGGNRIVAWHWLNIHASLVIRVPRDYHSRGCVIIEEHMGDGEGRVFIPHLHIDAEESSSVRVCWSFVGDGRTNSGMKSSNRFVMNAGMSVRAAANAKVDISQNQSLGDSAVCFIHNRLRLKEDAEMNFREFHFGASLVKTRTRAILGNKGASLKLKGAYTARKGQHLDLETIQEHRSPRAFSDALYKGVLMPGGRTVFSGLIEVSPQGAGTDAYLTNNNLLLGDGARADSIPRLNILTDDVKCSHGSTSGKLNEEHLFYLQSRGFPPAEARKELSRGFLAGVLDDAPGEIQNLLKERLDKVLDF